MRIKVDPNDILLAVAFLCYLVYAGAWILLNNY